MKTVTPELKTLMASGRYLTANLYTLTLQSGAVLRLTSAPDFDAVWGGNHFLHDLYLTERGTIKQALGIDVDSVDVTLYAKTTDTFLGLPIPHFVRNGGFNSARMLIQRAYFAIDNGGNVNTTATGAIFSFEGRVAEPKPSRTQVAFKVVADTELLNKAVPRNTITPSCSNRLFDARCGKVKADYTHSDVVVSASGLQITSGLSQPDDYFQFGTMTFSSGQNTGAKRSVVGFAGGVFTLARPFNHIPAAGDTFVAVAGCDLSEGVCLARFDNLDNRRAFKWVPPYEENL